MKYVIQYKTPLSETFETYPTQYDDYETAKSVVDKLQSKMGDDWEYWIKCPYPNCGVPNEETQQAMKEADQGKLIRYATPEEMFKKLGIRT